MLDVLACLLFVASLGALAGIAYPYRPFGKRSRAASATAALFAAVMVIAVVQQGASTIPAVFDAAIRLDLSLPPPTLYQVGSP
jgi:hypothetical protein